MYPQFFVEDLNIYHMLPHQYSRSFYGGPGDKVLKQKWVLDLASQAEIFSWECIETRIKIDDVEKGIQSQHWTTL